MRSNRAAVRAGVSMAATLPLLAGALALGIPAAHASTDPDGRDTLQGTKPLWATAQADKGATADASRVSARVYLAGRDAAGLSAYAKAVSDPSSRLVREVPERGAGRRPLRRDQGPSGEGDRLVEVGGPDRHGHDTALPLGDG